MPHCAAVGAAAIAFQAVDDLHGFDLGRPGEGAGRKITRQGREHVVVFIDDADNSAGNMLHMTVAPDVHQAAHLDGTKACHAADIVAVQVDDHVVLGNFLGIVQQPAGQLRVLGVVLATAGGAGEREGLHFTLAQPEQQFGTGTCRRRPA